MLREELLAELYRMRDEDYRAFQSRLIPTLDPERMLGVRTPALRADAKRLAGREDLDSFLSALPHGYFEENQLHAFLISGIREYAACLGEVDRFLPCVDNWATCDQLSPGVFRKHRPELLEHIPLWLRSEETYTLRFGLGMLMQHFLDEDFSPACAELAAGVRSSEYYVNMMQAWYFATALAKQYDQILPYIENRRLEPRTRSKAIRKALESRRITPEQKAFLRSLRGKE